MSWWDLIKLPYDQERVDACLQLQKRPLGQGLDVALAELMNARKIPWLRWERLRERGFGRAALDWLRASPQHQALKAGEILQGLSRLPEWHEYFQAPPPPPPPQPVAAEPAGEPRPLGILQPQRLHPQAQRIFLRTPGFVDHYLLARIQEDTYVDAPEGGSYVTTEASIQCWDCRTREHLWSWPHDGLLTAGTSQGSYWAHTRENGIALLTGEGPQASLDFPIWLDFLYPTPDGQTLIAASKIQSYRFDAAARRLTARRGLHQGVVNAHLMNAYFSADEDELLISFEETQLPVHRFRLRDLSHTPLRSSWRELPAFAHNQPAHKQKVLSPDGQWQVGLENEQLQLWECRP